MKFFRFLVVLFSLFLLVIILAADAGAGDRYFALLNAIPYADKTGHFILYGILAFLVNLGFDPTRDRILGIPVLRSNLILSGVALLEEFSQRYFPNRSVDIYDLIAGLAGIFLFGELGALTLKIARWLLSPSPGQAGGEK